VNKVPEQDQYISYYCEYCDAYHENILLEDSVLIDGFYYCRKSINEINELEMEDELGNELMR
jgi:hypothetical protein